MAADKIKRLCNEAVGSEGPLLLSKDVAGYAHVMAKGLCAASHGRHVTYTHVCLLTVSTIHVCFTTVTVCLSFMFSGADYSVYAGSHQQSCHHQVLCGLPARGQLHSVRGRTSRDVARCCCEFQSYLCYM